MSVATTMAKRRA
jgi:hypothetical protein